VYHVSLSAAPGETFTQAQWEGIADRFLQRGTAPGWPCWWPPADAPWRSPTWSPEYSAKGQTM